MQDVVIIIVYAVSVHTVITYHLFNHFSINGRRVEYNSSTVLFEYRSGWVEGWDEGAWDPLPEKG